MCAELPTGQITQLLIDYPLKQGLKLARTKKIQNIPQLLIDYPLKQGLKRLAQISSNIINSVLLIDYPLKQGLKPGMASTYKAWLSASY